MATALFEFSPTPTSLTLIRADFPPLDSNTSAPTNHEIIEPVAQLPEPDLAECDRFHIVNLYASGGQGQVFVARDEQLHRDVALKELKPKHANRALSRARFLREAEIAGGLEHPGVVPVYALGKHLDGRPFYAMRLIKGRTMHEWIRDFHRPQTPITQVERNVRFRQLLQRFISVCETIAYAHSRGIVHRDLKPSNILIGDFGEAIVVDWGLARRYNDVTGCGAEDENPSFSNPDSDSRADSTMMGSALGTPAFMSPEQAEGRWDQVGPVSDIYSLGATLYVLLTGHLPLKSLGWTEMSRRIRAGEIPPPRQVTPWVSRGLDAICRKAMAVKPSDRYSTSKALADDIERWLADEPVLAAPEPIRERVRRWVRHHRMFVTTMAAILVVTSIALGVGLFFVDKERNQTELARQNTQKALEDFTSNVIDQWLGEQHELRPEHREFLQKALKNQQAFANEKPNDPAGFLGVVKAYRRVGEIQMTLGLPKEAEEAFLQAKSRIQQIALPSDDVCLVRERAKLNSSYGKWNRIAGKYEQAEAEFAAARSDWESISKREPNDRETTKTLATSLNNHAIALADLKRPAEAAETFAEVLQHRLREVDESPDSRQAKRALVRAYTNLGICYLQLKKYSEAQDSFRNGIKFCQPLMTDGQTESDDNDHWAALAAKLGRVLMLDNKLDEADEWLATAAATFELLAARYPSRLEYAQGLTESRCNLGNVDYYRKQWTDAIKEFDLAKVGADKATKGGSSDPRLQSTVATIIELRARARSFRAMDNLKDGQRELAISETNELIDDPKCSATALYNCACILSQDGQLEKSLQILDRVNQRGYFACDPKNLSRLDADSDLAPLRDMPEFKAFRATLKSTPTSPSKK